MNHWLRGAWSALSAPWWLARRRRLEELLRPPEALPPGSVDPDVAVRSALATTRWLGRVPLGPWRNTCLYRSVAVSRVLRAYGRPAYIRLGVRSGTEEDAVVAHAWVEGAPPDVPDSAVECTAGLHPLAPPPGRTR